MADDPSPVLFPIVLVHGGLYQGLDVADFWETPGITEALDRRELAWAAADRPTTPRTWDDERDALIGVLELLDEPDGVVLVGAGDGCSVALRVATDRPDLVARLVLAWPATAGDPVADELVRVCMVDLEASEAETMLDGETLRGVTDDEIAALDGPVVVWPTLPDNQLHQRATVTRLIELLASPILVGGSPLPTAPSFSGFADAFADLMAEAALFDADDLAER